MKVGDSVLCFKTSKHASIINGVGCAGINTASVYNLGQVLGGN